MITKKKQNESLWRTNKQMNKLIGIKIDVTKLDKSRFFKGQKGTYAKLDIWVSDEKNRFGYDVSVSESMSKEDREANVKRNYVGEGKKLIGWDDNSSTSNYSSESTDNDDVPF